jgi:N-acetylglucosaminyl-diphospho-decaprenol L-rhamnosyltransferase
VIDLSVVIVNWNVRALLSRCLQSIAGSSPFVTRRPPAGAVQPRPVLGVSPAPQTHPEPRASKGGLRTMEVIVVDNASTDGSVDMLRREFPWVETIASEENLGFIRGSNQGIRASRGRYVLLLNPDTEVVGEALYLMVDHMEEHPRVGALGPQLRYPDGSIQSSRRRFPTLATAFLESTVLQQWFPHNRVLDRYYVNDRSEDDMQAVDWVVGACILLRRKAFEQVGLLDENAFMYSDELDWCRRAKSLGWSVVYLPAAHVIHHEGKSSEQAVAARHIHFQEAKIHYFRKYHGPWVGVTLRLFLLVTYVFQLLVEGAKWLVGHKRGLRIQRLRAYWQVLGSGLQPR